MSEPSLHSVQLQGLLELLRAGDRRARDELVRRTCHRLERLARKMLRGFPNVRRFADTGDVLNSALMRLLHTLEKVEPATTREFFGLAAEHVRRELIDLARHHAAQRRAADRVVSLGAGPSAGDDLDVPDAARDGADELETWCRFHQEVEKLPVREREVVGLKIYHGWTEKQIGELFDKDERTVRRWWREACVKLGDALGGEIPEV